MDVKGLAQVFHAHGAALDVPAGTPLAPGALPEGLAGLPGLPQREVHRVPLHVAHLDPRTGLQVVQVLADQPAVVAAPGLGVEVHVAVFGAIGQALGLQLLDQADDLADVLRGAGVHVRPLHADGLGVLEVFGDVLLRDGLHGGALFVGPLDHLVVDVGEVLHEGHVVAQVAHEPAQRVKDDEGAGVADVKIVVHGGPAGIDAALALAHRHEGLLFAGQGVVNHHLFHGDPLQSERQYHYSDRAGKRQDGAS